VKQAFKNALLASTAVATLLAVPAQAADMPIKAPPRAAVMTTWSGFYIGAHAGYGYAVTAITGGELDWQLGRIIGAGSKGFVAGGLGGYNYMLSSRWVGGIELDGNWQNIETKATTNFGQLKGSSDWSASVRARLGYLITPSMMVFGTAGWSWSSLDIDINGNGFVEQHSGGVSGPQVGFGVETMYTENWIIRTEYLHSFYDRVDFNTTVINGNPTQFGFSPWVGVIRSALIYKPGPSSPTPWPDRAPTPIWGGFYVGGLVGPLMANAKIKSPTQGVSVDGGGVSAVLPSVVAGYNILIAPRFLVGIEGEIAPNIATSDVEIEWTGSVRARGGFFVTPAVLAYGTIGWGTAGIQAVTKAGQPWTIPIERVHALVVGSGVEAAITDRWRLRADYQRFFSDTVNFSLPGGAAPIPATAKASGQVARLGAIYQLTGR
jgi:outer membrane immunogenic protein